MSERPQDEDELQALLAGSSALSRRYHELSDEQPPAQIDAAILAASRWAVGADTRRASSHHSGLHHVRAKWRRTPFLNWGVPLATAAVVVVAATLTLTIERDPEIARLNEKYDDRVLDRAEISIESAAGKIEGAPLSMPASPAKSVPPPISESATVSGPRSIAAKPGVVVSPNLPASPPTLAKKEATLQKDQASSTAPGRNLLRQPELGANQSEQRDGPGRVAADTGAADTGAAPVGAVNSAEAFPAAAAPSADRKRVDVADAVAPSADVTRDEMEVGAAASSQPEEIRTSASERSAARQRPATQTLGGEPAVEEKVATQDSPARSVASEAQILADQDAALRDPAAWIEDIEELLADGKRDQALASVKKFRVDYPDYQLPAALQALISTPSE